jgi:hypothetical protein
MITTRRSLLTARYQDGFDAASVGHPEVDAERRHHHFK